MRKFNRQAYKYNSFKQQRKKIIFIIDCRELML